MLVTCRGGSLLERAWTSRADRSHRASSVSVDKACQQGRVPIVFNDARERQAGEFHLGTGVVISWNGAASRYQLASASP